MAFLQARATDIRNRSRRLLASSLARQRASGGTAPNTTVLAVTSSTQAERIRTDDMSTMAAAPFNAAGAAGDNATPGF